MRTEIRKWGNSLAVRLPRDFVQSLQLAEGSQVELVLAQDGVLLRPVSKRGRRPGARSLDELLAGITPENLHAEVAWGEPQGREVW